MNRPSKQRNGQRQNLFIFSFAETHKWPVLGCLCFLVSKGTVRKKNIFLGPLLTVILSNQFNTCKEGNGRGRGSELWKYQFLSSLIFDQEILFLQVM